MKLDGKQLAAAFAREGDGIEAGRAFARAHTAAEVQAETARLRVEQERLQAALKYLEGRIWGLEEVRR